MGQGQACCTSKLKSLTNSAEYHPSLQVDETGRKNCWLLSKHGSHQALGGWKKTPNVFCTTSNKTGGRGYSVHNGAIGEARVPSTL